MRDEKPPPSLADLDKRLRTAREAHAPKESAAGPQRQIGLAYRVFVDLLAGIIVGGGIGWALDVWFGTRPWLLLVMLVLGMAGGFRNVMRTVNQMEAEALRDSERGRMKGSDGGGSGPRP
jgi:ATP synthase protein I